jgi:hypothetical protein
MAIVVVNFEPANPPLCWRTTKLGSSPSESLRGMSGPSWPIAIYCFSAIAMNGSASNKDAGPPIATRDLGVVVRAGLRVGLATIWNLLITDMKHILY